PVVVVMSSAFAPFPGTADAAQLGPPPKRKVEYGTGIVVSAAGHIVTDRQLTDGCNVVVVSGYGDADRLGEPAAGGRALLQVHGGGDIAPAPLAGDAAQGADRHCRSAKPGRRQRALDAGREAQGRCAGARATAWLLRRRRDRPRGA